jgi:hypothetical protein
LENEGVVNPQSEERPASSRRIGRRVALALYFAVIGYLAVVGLASVIPQLFFPATDPHRIGDCHAARDALTTELRTMAGDVIENGRDVEASTDAFFVRWDARFRAVENRCDDSTTASLGRLRYRLETTLRRYEREEAPLLRSLTASAGDTNESP